MPRLFDLRFGRQQKEEELEPDAAFPKGLKILVNPKDAFLDVVFVHGLTGDRERTWTRVSSDESCRVLWPRDLLPPCLPNARIMTFGYDAYIARLHHRIATNRIGNHSSDLLNALVGLRGADSTMNRPIVFVAHSLGGLVCKDALRVSRDSVELYLQDIFKSTRGIAFMGTPHAGSWLANWARLPVKSLGLLKRTDKNLLAILETDSEVLRRIHENFLIMLRRREAQQRPISVTCLFETLPLMPGIMIVHPDSGIILGYNHISVHAHHRDLVRFMHAHDPGFVSIAEVLQNWSSEIWSTLDGARVGRAPLIEKDCLLSQDRQDSLAISSAASRTYTDVPEEQLDTTGVVPNAGDDELSDTGFELSLEKKEWQQKCLETLFFPEMGIRQINVDKAAKDTCQWLFQDQRFKAWYNFENVEESHSLLWIKGKPGSGKSTLMKHCFDRLGLSSSPTRKRRFRMSYFFNARGTELERSPVGLYRTLIYQLCQQSRRVHRALAKSYGKLKAQLGANEVAWHLRELSTFFHEAIAIPRLPLIEVFVDALDECNDEDVRRFVRAFADSAAEAFRRGSKLRLCWSSRHYPHISVKHGIELRMEDLNQADIKKYVLQEFEISPLLSVEPYFAMEMVSRARGVFLWTVLVVRRLLKAADQGRSVFELQEILRRTPTELNELFQNLVASLDPDLRKETLNLIQWVMFSRLPLHIDTLQAALAYSSEHAPISLVSWAASLRHSQSLFASSAERRAFFKQFVTERSGGLFEVVYGQDTSSKSPADFESDKSSLNSPLQRSYSHHRSSDKYTVNPPDYEEGEGQRGHSWNAVLETLGMDSAFVQVIHESVRDFLLDEKSCDIYETQSPADFAELSNTVLFSACASFLQCQELTCALSASRSRKQFPNGAPGLVRDGRDWMSHSFTEYAHTCIWDHLRRSGLESGHLSLQGEQKDFIRRTFKQWWSLEISRGKALRDQEEELSLLERHERSSEKFWRTQCSRLVDHGVLSREQALEDRDCAENFHEGLLTLNSSGVMLKGRALECALVAAAHHGLDRLVASLIRKGISADCVDLRGHTALLEAGRGGHTTTVYSLLRHKASTEHSDIWTDPPLFTAAKLGLFDLVKCLLKFGADVHARNWIRETPIHSAAAGGHVQVIRALWHFGADIDSLDQYHESPLFKAIRANQTEAAVNLINYGADIERVNKLGNSPLIESAKSGSEATTRLLLSHGANCESTGWFGTSALYWAALSSNKNIVLLLLGAGSRTLLASEEKWLGQAAYDKDNKLSDDDLMLNLDLDSDGSQDGTTPYTGVIGRSRDPSSGHHVQGKLQVVRRFILENKLEAKSSSQS